ncbi:hypothetical protein IA57_11710 [Mangrovimonas yunxiaonensis]|uniref:Sugar transporter n=1 Tax=Mangrovimonas yunxiaonensis TaxID=1197477 RepID=A0A084THA9_9FLAO|nr:hypothetical protein [Mangrovimonas yunxiaonensis]KFB00095.1 hypothetical protein IA57_11710 [Mangrovimonas yunxiaonensis]MBR9757198.1 hypothetical protein [Algicola sp.]GGH41852.1 hypothetical protein GCM10011364_12940 [Mangrovimonas yunxiaonensis]
MNTQTSTKPPFWYWIIALLALVWNVMGVMQYLGQAFNTESWRSQYTEAQIAVVNSMPAWYTAAFAIAVFCGAFGSLALLIRKPIARLLFGLSLLAVVIQMGYLFSQGHTDNMAISLSIIVVAMLLVLFSRYASKKQWFA